MSAATVATTLTLTVTTVNIPADLQSVPHWVAWRIETRNGKPTKVPYDPRTNTKAKANDPKTWGTFGEALRASQNGAGYSGIGFMLGDGWLGVDVDRCRDPQTGEIQADALRIIGELDSYTEVSPSGTGVHVIVRGQLPAGGRRKGHVEMYDEKRYFTVTGNVVGDPRPVCERQAQLEALHAQSSEFLLPQRH